MVRMNIVCLMILKSGFGLLSMASLVAVEAISSTQFSTSNTGINHRRQLQEVAWIQIGADMDGEAALDFSGAAVAMSADGSRIAIGALQNNNGNGNDAGHVRVFDWTGSAWVQVGADIDGEAADDESGSAVAMSADGSRIAIGAHRNGGNDIFSGHVRVFDWTGSAWVQVGADIDGEAALNRSGNAVVLSADGSRIAVGAHQNNNGNGDDAGHVRVLDWTGSAWMQVGTDIDGEAAFDRSGEAVAMSADGSRIAIGALQNNGNGENSGHVRVFDCTGTSWVQVGTDIDGEAAFDRSGEAVAMSANGSRIAIGANQNDGNGSRAGHVRVFDWTGSSWVQVGTDIDGEAADDESGWSVAMSAGGSRIAIGAHRNGGNGIWSGHVRVFDWTGSAWVQIGTNIDGEASLDESGQSVAMSADGSRIAIGAPENGGNGRAAGHVRVFSVNNVEASLPTAAPSTEFIPSTAIPTLRPSSVLPGNTPVSSETSRPSLSPSSETQVVDSNDGLSIGAIAGIALGGLLLLILVFVAGKCTNRRDSSKPNGPDTNNAVANGGGRGPDDSSPVPASTFGATDNSTVPMAAAVLESPTLHGEQPGYKSSESDANPARDLDYKDQGQSCINERTANELAANIPVEETTTTNVDYKGQGQSYTNERTANELATHIAVEEETANVDYKGQGQSYTNERSADPDIEESEYA